MFTTAASNGLGLKISATLLDSEAFGPSFDEFVSGLDGYNLSDIPASGRSNPVGRTLESDLSVVSLCDVELPSFFALVPPAIKCPGAPRKAAPSWFNAKSQKISTPDTPCPKRVRAEPQVSYRTPVMESCNVFVAPGAPRKVIGSRPVERSFGEFVDSSICDSPCRRRSADVSDISGLFRRPVHPKFKPQRAEIPALDATPACVLPMSPASRRQRWARRNMLVHNNITHKNVTIRANARHNVHQLR